MNSASQQRAPEDSFFGPGYARDLSGYADSMVVTSRELFTSEGRALKHALQAKISSAYIDGKIDIATYNFYQGLVQQSTTKDGLKDIAADFMGITEMDNTDTGEFIKVLTDKEM